MKVSINTINQQKYKISDNLHDSKNIEDFLERNFSKKVIFVAAWVVIFQSSNIIDKVFVGIPKLLDSLT